MKKIETKKIQAHNNNYKNTSTTFHLHVEKNTSFLGLHFQIPNQILLKLPPFTKSW